MIFTFFTCNFLPGQFYTEVLFGMVVQLAKLYHSMVWLVVCPCQSKVGGWGGILWPVTPASHNGLPLPWRHMRVIGQ